MLLGVEWVGVGLVGAAPLPLPVTEPLEFVGVEPPVGAEVPEPPLDPVLPLVPVLPVGPLVPQGVTTAAT